MGKGFGMAGLGKRRGRRGAHKGRFLTKGHRFPPCGILWEVAEPTTTRREAMFCPAGFDQGLTMSMQPLSHVSKPQATVLALWSVGMVLARSCALTAVRHW